MTITKSKILKNFEVDGESKTISIAFEWVVTDSVEGEIGRKKFRRAFVPGQIEDVKAWTGAGNNNPYIVFLNAIWA